MKSVFTAFLCVAVLGCATTRAVDQSHALSQTTAAKEARVRAPDLHARAVDLYARADEAQQAGDTRAAADLRTEGRLWLAVAVAESERIAMQEERLSLLDAEDRLHREANRYEALEKRRVQTESRQAAVSVAAEQAAQLKAWSKGDRVEQAKVHSYLLERASLNLSAALALGAQSKDVAEVTRALDVARKRRNVREADALLARSESLLGQTRAQTKLPDAALTSQLMSDAYDRGYEASADEFGVMVFDRDARLGTARQLKRLAHMKRLLALYPHGEVFCSWLYARRAPTANQVIAVQTHLLANETRKITVDAKPSLEGLNALRCVLPAYVAHAATRK